MAGSWITLTTDFGLSDHYVGVMKGVIARIAPSARVIDLCHEITSYGLAEAAFTIAQSYRYFPPGTVHLVVVDPGVGTSRKALLAEVGGYRFVAPDNGVLSQVMEQEEFRVWAVDAARFALQPTSRTFHARDLFSPVAAHAARGKASEEFGESFDYPARLPRTAPEETAPGCWRGRVLAIDHFGNIVTSFPAAMLPANGKSFHLRAGKARTSCSAQTYEHAGSGELFVITGSSGYLELSLRQDSAAARTQVSVGDPVEFRYAPTLGARAADSRFRGAIDEKYKSL